MSEGKLYQVLLVDDDLLVLDDLKTMIDWEEEGFQIAAIAHNGEEALACMKETLIDIIIVDIEHISGKEAIELKKNCEK